MQGHAGNGLHEPGVNVVVQGGADGLGGKQMLNALTQQLQPVVTSLLHCPEHDE